MAKNKPISSKKPFKGKALVSITPMRPPQKPPKPSPKPKPQAGSKRTGK